MTDKKTLLLSIVHRHAFVWSPIRINPNHCYLSLLMGVLDGDNALHYHLVTFHGLELGFVFLQPRIGDRIVSLAGFYGVECAVAPANPYAFWHAPSISIDPFRSHLYLLVPRADKTHCRVFDHPGWDARFGFIESPCVNS